MSFYRLKKGIKKMADESIKPVVVNQTTIKEHNEQEKQRLSSIKKQAYDCLYDLAEIEQDEFYNSDDECEEVEYMLEKVMRDGTYRDAGHGMHYFIDYMHAKNALKCI